MSQVFPSAEDLANQTNQQIVNQEVNSITEAVLYASSNGLVDVIVSGTIITSTTVGTWANITAINGTTSTFTLGSNGYTSGQEVFLQVTGTSVLPSPLLQNIVYYAIPIDANNFQLGSSFIAAIQNQPITLLNTGVGTTQIQQLSIPQQYALVWTGIVNDRAKRAIILNVQQYFLDLDYSIYPSLNPATNNQTLVWNVSF